jgi:hypothetical protein
MTIRQNRLINGLTHKGFKNEENDIRLLSRSRAWMGKNWIANPG